MTDLAALARMLDAATEPNRELDADLAVFFLPEQYRHSDSPQNRLSGWVVGLIGGEPRKTESAPRYTASVDAALALMERVLPGWKYSITNIPSALLRQGEFRCDLRAHRGRARAGAFAPTLPLAILKAMVAAKMQEDRG